MAHQRGKYTSRTKARKRAADILFEADQKGLTRNPAALRGLLSERQALTSAPSPLPEYSVRIIEGISDDLPGVDRLLDRHAKGAGLDRLPAVDVAVMRVAVWEMLHNAEEVPPITAIDEAVAIVKDLSTDDSPAYVNAVLDAVRKSLDNPWHKEQSAKDTPVDNPTDDWDDEAIDEY
ncbi:transcription antitermination factor NusB [Actinomycetaceae bacterium MB13-C1-2]|nr:transcription antitermination factor NusB [Actinomycetaceae bacterium MB13-C1-2]